MPNGLHKVLTQNSRQRRAPKRTPRALREPPCAGKRDRQPAPAGPPLRAPSPAASRGRGLRSSLRTSREQRPDGRLNLVEQNSWIQPDDEARTRKQNIAGNLRPCDRGQLVTMLMNVRCGMRVAEERLLQRAPCIGHAHNNADARRGGPP